MATRSPSFMPTPGDDAIQWNQPESLRQRQLAKALRMAWRWTPVAIIAVLVVFAVLYYLSSDLPPTERYGQWGAFWLRMGGMVLFVLLAFLWGLPFLLRGVRNHYAVDDKGLYWYGQRPFHLPWSRLQGYRLELHPADNDHSAAAVNPTMAEDAVDVADTTETHPGNDDTVLLIHYAGLVRPLPLPEEAELADAVLAEVKRYGEIIPPDDPRFLPFEFTSRAVAVFVATLAIYTAGLWLWMDGPGVGRRLPVVALLTMILGPGTLGVYWLSGTVLLKNKKHQAAALLVNFLAMHIVIVFVLLLIYRQVVHG